MSRTLTSGMQTASEASLVRPFFLIDLEFTSGSVYLWTGHGDLSWNSNTYIGAGDIMELSAFEETTDLGAAGASVTLTGIKSSLVTKARDENYQGRPIHIRLGAFDSTASIITDPVIVFTGFMDIMTINEAAEVSTIQVSALRMASRLQFVLSASAVVQNTCIVNSSCVHECVFRSLAPMLAKWFAPAQRPKTHRHRKTCAKTVRTL
jgi:hypothetical protein